MERIISDNEKIRRAEEIYYRRNNRNININNDNEYEKNKSYLGSRVLLKLLVVLNIVIVVFGIQNKDYIFTKEFLENISKYNIDLNEKVKNLVNSFIIENKDNNYEILNDNKENIILNNTESEKENVIYENNDENQKENIKLEKNMESENMIQNEIIENDNNIKSNEENISLLSQMDFDIQNLKNAYYFIKPIEGIVSSSFGARESKYQNVTGYHTGVDIASKSGTIIKASMEGIVELVSNKGDYRKTYKNSFK